VVHDPGLTGSTRDADAGRLRRPPADEMILSFNADVHHRAGTGPREDPVEAHETTSGRRAEAWRGRGTARPEDARSVDLSIEEMPP
jgi:hypothetical protein